MNRLILVILMYGLSVHNAIMLLVKPDNWVAFVAIILTMTALGLNAYLAGREAKEKGERP